MTTLVAPVVPFQITYSSSGISEEAQAGQIATSAVQEEEERSFALFGFKADAISRMWEVVEECEETGWDGGQAEPISEIAAQIASNFIRALPEDVPLPEAAPEPDGCISLDWIKSRSRLFSLSVCSGNALAYAWLDGHDRGHAVARFDGQTVPARILDGIRQIMNGNPALRPL